jgi:molybdate transport system regulatory protein
MDPHFKIGFRIWISGETATFLGEGRVSLLRYIHETGSISEASKRMGISYKKALKLLDTMNKQSLKPLVVSVTGGAKGGGSVVTQEGLKAIETFQQLSRGCANYLNKELKKLQTS